MREARHSLHVLYHLPNSLEPKKEPLRQVLQGRLRPPKCRPQHPYRILPFIIRPSCFPKIRISRISSLSSSTSLLIRSELRRMTLDHQRKNAGSHLHENPVCTYTNGFTHDCTIYACASQGIWRYHRCTTTGFNGSRSKCSVTIARRVFGSSPSIRSKGSSPSSSPFNSLILRSRVKPRGRKISG